jgi:hypothetical protein
MYIWCNLILNTWYIFFNNLYKTGTYCKWRCPRYIYMMTNPTCDWYTMCVLGSFISSYPTCDWYTMCVLGSFISSYPTCDWYTMCVLGSFISPYPTCDWYTVCALDNFLQRSTWNMKSMYDSSFYFTFGNLYLPSTYSFRYDPLFSKLVVISQKCNFEIVTVHASISGDRVFDPCRVKPESIKCLQAYFIYPLRSQH